MILQELSIAFLTGLYIQVLYLYNFYIQSYKAELVQKNQKEAVWQKHINFKTFQWKKTLHS